MSVFQSLRSTGPVNVARSSKCIMKTGLLHIYVYVPSPETVFINVWQQKITPSVPPSVSLVLSKRVTPRSRVSTLQQMEWMT